MPLAQLLIGKPLATSDERAECIGPIGGIPVFGLDALSSAAYGPEAALTLLIPLGFLGIEKIIPVTFAIIGILGLVYASYLQTIDAYPNGGGSYTVASENLGLHTGLIAAAALMVDYILNAAVGISAGVGALVSALPALQPHTLGLCLAILVVLTLVNIRGIKDTGTVFLIPTYLFVGTLLLVIGVGTYHALTEGGHPRPLVAPPQLPATGSLLTLWLLAKVFASGCTAMTGVEAVSNGVNAFRPPSARNAKVTLTTIIALLVVLLAGIALLCRAYGIGATDPDGPGYQSVLSQLTFAVMGRGWFYYLAMASILSVLALSANTSFADFPRLTRAIALRGCLPHVFKIRGRRLLYSYGIYALVGFTAVLLIVFGGVTDRLIPLFAIGAFLAFTLSQAGMVVHWRRKGRGFRLRMVVNGVGAAATGLTTLIVLMAKFTDGAWITAILVPVLIVAMIAAKRHYEFVAREVGLDRPLRVEDLSAPIVVVPIDRWSRMTEKGLRFALKLSGEIQAVHVMDTEDSPEEIQARWERNIAVPLRAAGHSVPEFVLLPSPYRYILPPLIDYILDLEKRNPTRQLAVLIPELMVRRVWERPLHNQRANLLKLLLLARGNRQIVVINIPWYL